MTAYPRVYWHSPNLASGILGVGIAQTPSSSRRFGWRHFTPTSAEEWRDFPLSFSFSPEQEWVVPPLQTPVQYRIDRSISLPSRSDWIQIVERALQNIQARRFEKVVCARRVEIQTSSSIDAMAVCQSLSTSAGRTVFLFQPTPHSAFIGSSPERLFRRTRSFIECDALAGTRPIDQMQDLLLSKKDFREFSIVQERLLHALTPICSTPPSSSPYQVRGAGRIGHLYAKITGHLNQPICDEELIHRLHPNPAIGGHPHPEALAFLKGHEPFARGLYAAPVGWTDTEEAEWIVGIRSCLIQGSRAYLYAGTGIVEGSDPEAEWEETEQKLAEWNNIFIAPGPTLSSTS